MKTITFFKAGLLVISAVFVSCEDEVSESLPPSSPPVSLEFQTDHQVLAENQIEEVSVGLAIHHNV